MRIAVAGALAVALLLLPCLGVAHTRSVSYSSWTVDEDHLMVAVHLRLSALDLQVLQVAEQRRPEALSDRLLSDVLPERFEAVADELHCPVRPASFQRRAAANGYATFVWTVECSQAVTDIEVSALFDEIAGHLHLVHVALPDGAVLDAPLSERHRTIELAAPGAPPAGGLGDRLLAFGRMGAEHILSGWDHLVFLLALVLAIGTLRRLPLVITGFTVGHSLTLGLAVFGVVAPDTQTAEALIGFSVVVVALESGAQYRVQETSGTERASSRTAIIPMLLLSVLLMAAMFVGVASPWALTGSALFAWCYWSWSRRAPKGVAHWLAVPALFGLLHGLGFAGPLIEMSLPPGDLALALVGFNLGVECGQLLAVTVIVAVL